jgi:trans-aconitate 2-methyltransferase
MPWDPEQYRKFESERFAPFDDLFAMIAMRSGLRVIDLGCGTGELTARLAGELPESAVVGIDASAEMLAEANTLADRSLRFEQRAIEDVNGTWDLVFSHAALQWVDDHEALIPRIFALVAPGGQLAVQVPSNHHHASHVLIRETASEEPFRTALNGWTRAAPVLPSDAYAGILHAEGATDVAVIEKVYPHVLENAAAIADWVRGTALIPYLERLPADVREPFMTRYRDKLQEHFPESPVFYPFRRTLFVATRPG